MKNPAPYLRRTLFTLLNVNVSYNAANVPVYENDEDHDDALQIVIGDYSDADRSNAHEFGANATQVIEIVSWQDTGAKKTVDAIGELVNNIIMPTPQSATLNGADFHIIVNRPSINHIIEDSGNKKKIVRLILRYSLLIHHN